MNHRMGRLMEEVDRAARAEGHELVAHCKTVNRIFLCILNFIDLIHKRSNVKERRSEERRVGMNLASPKV